MDVNSTLLHVCWHRHESLSFEAYKRALKNELSGVLLRRFKKKEMGWQRLWVVYSNFNLYFFKRAHDENCIASLPILGYSIEKVKKSGSTDKLSEKTDNATNNMTDDYENTTTDVNLTNNNARNDDVDKDFVLKLCFKNHIYYFAADNEYCYERWYHVLKNF